MSATLRFVAPRPLIVGAPLNPNVSNYQIAVGYRYGGDKRARAGISGTYSASVTEDRDYVIWSVSFVASIPTDFNIPSGAVGFIYAYDPSTKQVLDFVTFNSPGIQGGTGLVVNASAKIAKCVYATLNCNAIIVVCNCANSGNTSRVAVLKETSTYEIDTGLHTFKFYSTYTLSISFGILCNVGESANCYLACVGNKLYDLASIQVTGQYETTYYGCTNILKDTSVI